MSVIVYGKSGCGKSTNAEALRKAYLCDHVLDDWDGLSLIGCYTLALTEVPPPYNTFIPAVAYEDAVRHFNIDGR